MESNKKQPKEKVLINNNLYGTDRGNEINLKKKSRAQVIDEFLLKKLTL